MYSAVLAILTQTGKIVISIEAVLVACLLGVLVAMCLKIARDKKRGTYDGDTPECTGETECVAEKARLEQCRDVDCSDVKEIIFRKPETQGQSDDQCGKTHGTDDICADLAAPAAQAKGFSFADAGMLVTPSLDEVFEGRSETDGGESEDEEEDYDGKIIFISKMSFTGVENKAIYNALKNEILSYKNIKSRVTNGGDYFRIPGKQLIKLVLIGKTLRMAIALNPSEYDYNIYHQKDRGGMKKYENTPMFVKVQSRLGVKRAETLIADCMRLNGVKKSKKYQPLDYARLLAMQFEASLYGADLQD